MLVLKILLLPLRIVAIIVNWIIQLLCWQLTGHAWEIVSQRQSQFDDPAMEVCCGEWITYKRCRRCGAEMLSSGGKDDTQYPARIDQPEPVADSRRRA